MKFILKILLAPMVYVMYLLILFLTFVLSLSTVILNIAATLIGMLAVFAMITESVSNGIVMLVIAWMLSPVGLPMFAGWLLEKAESLRTGQIRNIIDELRRHMPKLFQPDSDGIQDTVTLSGILADRICIACMIHLHQLLRLFLPTKANRFESIGKQNSGKKPSHKK